MSTFTPGPWTYMEHMHEEEQGNFLVKADCQKRPLVLFIANEEDARLIAAAPELLDALEDAATIINGLATGKLPKCFAPNLEVVNKVNYAIAKARQS